MYYTINLIFFMVSICIIFKGIFYKNGSTFLKKIYSKLEIIINKYYKIIILLLFFVTCFTSLYKIGNVPYGLHVDEAGMAYDAISLVNFHMDRYQNHFPVYLINYGGGQSAMYAYLAALLIKLFGYSIKIIRLPAVLFRIVIFISILFIMKDEKNKLKTIIFLYLFSICPYFIMQSRWGLDCNLLVGSLSIAIAVLIRAIEKNLNYLFLISGLLFGLCLYTYALSYIIIPILLIMIFLYLLYIKKIQFKQIIIFAIPLFIFALPLILMILVNNDIIEEIHGFITIPKLPEYRGAEISLKNIVCSSYIITCIFSYDNPVIFNDSLIYNSLPNFGTIYYISIPFFIIGFVQSLKMFDIEIRNKEFKNNIIFVFWFFSVLLCQILIETPNINKANAIFVPILYFITLGIMHVIRKENSIIIPIIIIFTLNFILFLNYYFYHYNNDYSDQYFFATDYFDAIEFSKTLEKKHVYVQDRLSAEEYIYVLLDNKVSPYEYKKEDIIVNYNNTNIVYNFSIPANGTLDDAYIISSENNMVGSFENIGFSSKKFGKFIVYYMDNNK